MTKAAGFYNTMLESDDPAIVVECLNGYRLKEKITYQFRRSLEHLLELLKLLSMELMLPCNIWLLWRIVMEAANELEAEGISAEVIDVQSLIPFDVNHKIVESISKPIV